MRKEKHLEEEEADEDEEVIYKIEVPANRYLDILHIFLLHIEMNKMCLYV